MRRVRADDARRASKDLGRADGAPLCLGSFRYGTHEDDYSLL